MNSEKKPKNKKKFETLGAVVMTSGIAMSPGATNAEVIHYDEKGIPVGEKSQVESPADVKKNFKGKINFDNFTATPEDTDNVLDLEPRPPENILGDFEWKAQDVHKTLKALDCGGSYTISGDGELKIEIPENKDFGEASKNKIREYITYMYTNHWLPDADSKNTFNEVHKIRAIEVKVGPRTYIVSMDYNNSFQKISDGPNETAIMATYDILQKKNSDTEMSMGVFGGAVLNKQLNHNGDEAMVPIAGVQAKATHHFSENSSITLNLGYIPSVNVPSSLADVVENEKPKTPEVIMGGIQYQYNF